MKILKCRTIALHPNLLFEIKVCIESNQYYFCMEVEENQPICIDNIKSFIDEIEWWCFNKPADESDPHYNQIYLSDEINQMVLKKMISIYNDNPTWDSSEKWILLEEKGA